MKIIHLHREDFKTTLWSGGRTTELFLSPPEGDYGKRDFLFRISSATVELEESDFTALDGVERYITPLDGSFVLSHPDSAPVALAPLSQPYGFSGGIPTHCIGKATDFNLMLKGCQGKMELWQDSAPVRIGFNSYYPTEDAVFKIENQSFSLKKGEMLVIFSEKDSILSGPSTKFLGCWVNV